MALYFYKFLFLFVLMILLLILNVIFGTIYLPIQEVLTCIFDNNNCNSVFNNILFQLRLPSACLAILAGASLSLSGLLMQTFFKNPIAGPYVLGVSAGASLGVAILLVVAPQFLINFGSWAQSISAAFGAASVLAFILILSININNNSTILIIGLMLSSAISAVVEVLQFTASTNQLQRFLSWTMSGVQSANWVEVQITALVLSGCLFLAFSQSKNLNLLLLGRNYAISSGLNYNQTRFILFLCTALLAGTVTAFCGMVAFVGMGVPPLARWWFRTASHYILIVAVLLIGANVLLFCQFVANLISYNQTVPLNALTSLFGLPFILWFIYKNKQL